ncbi:chorismate mutase [bacterium]|nr:chorismate mutase [bacterium]
MSDLLKKREEIDVLDKRLVEILDQRADLVKEMSKIKKSENQPQVYVPGREEFILSKIEETHKGSFPNQVLRSIFTEVISACRNLESSDKIAFLGERYGWAHDAAQNQFGSSAGFVGYEQVNELISSLYRGEVALAFVPIFNGNYGIHSLLESFLSQDFFFVAETLAKPIFSLVTRSKDETEIFSKIFLTKETFNLIRSSVSSLSVPAKLIICQTIEEVVENLTDSRQVSGLVPHCIAKTLGLKTVKSPLESTEEGLIRCVTISLLPNAQRTPTMKTTILAALPQNPGALVTAISPLHENKINILSVETFRFQEKPWKDLFLIDFEPPKENEKLLEVVGQIQKQCLFLKFLGFYPVLN